MHISMVHYFNLLRILIVAYSIYSCACLHWLCSSYGRL